VKHWRRQLSGTGARARLPQLFNFSGHFRQSRTNSDIRLHLVAYRVKDIRAYRFVAVYCMNFIIFLCVTLKLFSLSFLPLLPPNPGDAIGVK